MPLLTLILRAEKALFGLKEWYFFTPRDRKYPNGSRPNRAAGRGYWKATGADKPIAPRGSAKAAGIKKALVFYSGKAPKGVKTDWIIHEYRLADADRAPGKKVSQKVTHPDHSIHRRCRSIFPWRGYPALVLTYRFSVVTVGRVGALPSVQQEE
jgi:hypothetical protein